MQISGDDLLAIGIPAGRQIGRILQALLEDVLEIPYHTVLKRSPSCHSRKVPLYIK